MNSFPLFSLIYTVLALLFLLTQHRRPYPRSYLVKAAPILLLAAVAAQAQAWWLCAALLFSAGGDIALDLDHTRYFVQGLGLFLVAHVCYVLIFGQAIAFGSIGPLPIMLILGTLLFALFFIRLLLPHLGKLKAPVLVYIGIIVAMGITAVLVKPFNAQLVAGAYIFMASDASIAIDKFVKPYPFRDAIVMVTYYVAQYLLTWAIIG